MPYLVARMYCFCSVPVYGVKRDRRQDLLSGDAGPFFAQMTGPLLGKKSSKKHRRSGSGRRQKRDPVGPYATGWMMLKMFVFSSLILAFSSGVNCDIR